MDSKGEPKHGIGVKELALDFGQMMQRKKEVVEGLTNGVALLFKKHEITRVQGVARFSSSHLLEVKGSTGTQVVEAENFILAIGSESTPLPFLPFDERRVLSSTGALALQEVPKKMLVIGAGVIGVELASVYRRLGAEVVIVEMLDRICPPMDLAISRAFLQLLKKQGLEFHLGAKVTKAVVEETGVSLTFEENKETFEQKGDVVLVAVGRRPCSQGMGLKEFGIGIDAKGFVEVDGNFRTGQPHIYAIGDLIDGPMLAHKASEEGVAAAEIIAGLTPHINYMAIPNVVYTHPEVAAVGLTEEEARAAGMEVRVGTCSLKAIGRARCMGDTEGILKVIGEAHSGRLVGMHLISPHASEMIGEGVLAIEKRATLEEIANAPHAHPTLSEGVKEAALNALGRQIAF